MFALPRLLAARAPNLLSRRWQSRANECPGNEMNMSTVPTTANTRSTSLSDVNGKKERKPRTSKPKTPRIVATKIADLLESLPVEHREKALATATALMSLG